MPRSETEFRFTHVTEAVVERNSPSQDGLCSCLHGGAALLPVATDASQEELGTEFYRRSLKPSAWLRDPKGFETVKTTPFLPNAAFAFAVLNTMRVKSWHGRTALTANSGTRNSLLNIWYADAHRANREIIAENKRIEPLSRETPIETPAELAPPLRHAA